jgi:threonine dehydratase
VSVGAVAVPGGGELDPRLRYDGLRQAHELSAPFVNRTPILPSAELSAMFGGTVALKAECLQRTGSFKLRGAFNKLRQLASERGDCPGVIAGSAGNHAQSLAYAAKQVGLSCEVFMPEQAPLSKLAAVEGFGGLVHQRGSSVDECVEMAKACAAEFGLEFVHPFDDYDIVAGQAGVGLEIAQDVADVRKVVVPVGGGGLVSGIAVALMQQRPEVEIIGVQAAACAPVADPTWPQRPELSLPPETLADGIAVKRPGTITLPLIQSLISDVVTVEEDTIAAAMVMLLSRCRLVTEGAGAVALAALLSGAIAPASHGTTVLVLSGGNVDTRVLAGTALRSETNFGRRARLFTRVPDRPGGLAGLVNEIANAGANVLAVEHVRDGVSLPINQTGVALTIETRGANHLSELVDSLNAAGYELEGYAPAR